MKKFFDKIGNNKLLIILVIILQIIILILIVNPFAIISENELKGLINEVVTLADDPDFRNATAVKITDSEAFKTQYLLGEKYSDLNNDDYVLLINNKFIIYRRAEKKIIFKGDAPAALLDVNRLENLIQVAVVDQKLITNSEQPAVKIYNPEVDGEKYADYFQNLENGDVLAFFPQNKLVVLFNLQTTQIKSNKAYKLSD